MTAFGFLVGIFLGGCVGVVICGLLMDLANGPKGAGFNIEFRKEG